MLPEFEERGVTNYALGLTEGELDWLRAKNANLRLQIAKRVRRKGQPDFDWMGHRKALKALLAYRYPDFARQLILKGRYLDWLFDDAWLSTLPPAEAADLLWIRITATPDSAAALATDEFLRILEEELGSYVNLYMVRAYIMLGRLDDENQPPPRRPPITSIRERLVVAPCVLPKPDPDKELEVWASTCERVQARRVEELNGLLDGFQASSSKVELDPQTSLAEILEYSEKDAIEIAAKEGDVKPLRALYPGLAAAGYLKKAVGRKHQRRFPRGAAERRQDRHADYVRFIKQDLWRKEFGWAQRRKPPTAEEVVIKVFNVVDRIDLYVLAERALKSRY